MTKEKEIEVISKDINKSPWKLEQDLEGCHINSSEIAEYLYSIGYRKQSEGEWKLAYNSSPHYFCSHCNHLSNNKPSKYCPYCGAKMKGGGE